MAQYQYDGSMAAYFLLTFLFLVLVPLTYSFVPAAARTWQLLPTSYPVLTRPFRK